MQGGARTRLACADVPAEAIVSRPISDPDERVPAMRSRWRAPTGSRRTKARRDLWLVITHPAFRLGFLDAQDGRPWDQERIAERIRTETPRLAWQRFRRDTERSHFNAVEIAQYRYEEGRLAVLEEGLRCKTWSDPGRPPADLRAYIALRAAGVDAPRTGAAART